eukprot:13593976-Alexandrium_andersonii.AAC.1
MVGFGMEATCRAHRECACFLSMGSFDVPAMVDDLTQWLGQHVLPGSEHERLATELKVAKYKTKVKTAGQQGRRRRQT